MEINQYPPPPPPSQPPAPDYAGTPAPDYYGPAEAAVVEAPQGPKKNKTAVIIIAVVIGLLLCCCTMAAAGALLFMSSDSETTDGGLPPIEDLFEDIPGTSDGPATDSGWDAFQPGPYDTTEYTVPDERHMTLITEIASALYPDFTVTDVVLDPGYEDETTYYSDTLFVQATLASDPAVRIAFDVDIELVQAWEAGASYSEDSLADYEALGLTSNETEYTYNDQRLAGFLNGVSDTELVTLLAQVQADFPDSVADYAEIDGDSGYVTITRWEAYPPYSGGFDVTYDRSSGAWELADAVEW